MEPTTVGKRIAALRRERGMTQTDLAEKVGLTSGMPVSRWERGDASPRGEHLIAVARALGTTVEALAGDEEHAPTVAPTATDRECA